MVKTLVLAGIAFIGASVWGAAQLHPNGYAVGVINATKMATEPSVLILDSVGNVVWSVPAGLNNTHGLTMDYRNTLLVATDLSWMGSTPCLHFIDPLTGTNVSCLGSFPPGFSLRDIVVGQNGNFFVSESNTDTIYRVDQNGNFTSVATVGDNPWGGMCIDIDTSHLLVQSTSNATGDALRRIARDGSSVTVLATGFDARFGITQHIPTGDVWSSSGNAPLRLYRRSIGAPTPSVVMPAGSAAAYYCVRADRASAVNQRLIAGECGISCAVNGGLSSYDLTTNAGTGIAAALPGGKDAYDVEILFRRNVHSNKTGPGRWRIGIKIPEDAGSAYLLVPSLSGVRPGVSLPDGRSIALVPDAVTQLSLTVGLGSILSPTAGVLDAAGEATADLDVSTFGPAILGQRIWLLALTTDGLGGFRTISDPHVIEFE